MTERDQEPLCAPLLRVCTFGPFRVERRVCLPGEPPQYAAVPDQEWEDRVGPAVAVLKFLVCCQNRQATKRFLAEGLWPERPEDKALNSLRVAKGVLSKVLQVEGKSLLSETVGGLGLHLAGQDELEVDADRFEAAMQEASLAESTQTPERSLAVLRQAYALRRGPFLPDEVGERWSELRRQEVEILYEQCVLRLALAYRVSGQLMEAERLLRSYWATHQTNEEVLCQLMELVASRGERLAALRFYRQSAQALRDELGVAPSESLKGLAEHIRKQGLTHNGVLLTPAVGGSHQLSSDGLLLPAHLIPSSWTVMRADSPTAFGELATQLVHAILRWHGRSLQCETLQGLLSQELDRWNQMNTSDQEFVISRRTALATLAALPLAMVPAILRGQRSPLVIEEFLPECTAAITASWYLMMGDGLTTVAEQLPKFLPALEQLAQQPSRYQKTAAKLAAQGYLLMGLVALHNLNVPLRVSRPV